MDEFRHELHVAVTDDAAGTAKKLEPLIPHDQTLFVHIFPHARAELEAIMSSVQTDWQGFPAKGIYLSAAGLDEKRNCVTLSIDPVNPDVVASFTSRYGEALEFQFSPRPAPVPSTWPTEPEVAQAVEAVPPQEQLVTCGGHLFPASVLADPGTEDVPADLADALHAAVAYWSPELPELTQVVWRLAYRDDATAQFIGKLGGSWATVDLVRDSRGWRPDGMGAGCQPGGPGIEGAGSATWVFDPDYALPTADSTVLHVLITEGACSGGIPAFGRIVPPVVVYGTDTLTLTVGVRPVGGIATCPGNPPTPATVVLPRPLGDRVVYSGALFPPGPPGTPEP